MSTSNGKDIVARFGLISGQRDAVQVAGHDVVVTAGAGSGKTRTLVARYLWLLGSGAHPRRIVAITFTEKAAREMRNRVRVAIAERAAELHGPEAGRWREFEAGMDAARIGTIHSLCSEILRAHPAEVGVDPLFEVIEEASAAALLDLAVEDAMLWAVEQPDLAHLYRSLTARQLEGILSGLLKARLEVEASQAGDPFGGDPQAPLAYALDAFLSRADVRESIVALRSFGAQDLVADANQNLADQIQSLIGAWSEMEQALAEGRALAGAQILFAARREHMATNIGARSSTAKEHLKALREAYKEGAAPWLGGESSSDPPPDPSVEEAWLEDRPPLRDLYQYALARYQSSLEHRGVLDFDDLESGAVELLRMPAIQKRWAGAFDAVLVDEFQDTNARQREIVEALTSDRPGKLFIVGDARQSIYRFRGADVRVFRQAQQDITSAGGEHIELDRTFRGHAGLLQGFDDLLPPFMGKRPDPQAPFAIPYSSLSAHRQHPRPGTADPYLEIILGLGENAADARPSAAGTLAERLLEMNNSGELTGWDDVALLFRASSGFEHYEAALESRDIPFVTVAGRGFYERPEVRDVLNILRALAEPWDDTAMAGLLRSPAFGVSDAGLHQLRVGPDGLRSFREAMELDPPELDDSNRGAVLRAGEFLEAMGPYVERVPVADLLKRVLDELDLRALMAAGRARAWRNLDKLLDDARASELVRVSAFLDYLRTLRDVGAREGEAPAEAVGAVRLMTIHKAKGLEFEVVVLADASRAISARSEPVYLTPEIGLAWNPDRIDSTPLAYSVSKWIDGLESAAEEARVLYVAMTRAREKLIISGHLTQRRESWSASGWTSGFLDILGLDADAAAQADQELVTLPAGAQIAVSAAGAGAAPGKYQAEVPVWPGAEGPSLVDPIHLEDPEALDELMAKKPARLWRATGKRVRPPAAVVGLAVHAALALDAYDGEPIPGAQWEPLLFREGIVDPGQRRATIREVEKLVERFRASPTYADVQAAEDRRTEVPFSYLGSNGKPDSGRIDLLYRANGSWIVIDFKADELRDEEALAESMEEYRPQMERYRTAVERLLGTTPRVRLCFLDYAGTVRLVDALDRPGP